jgi:hypothetical protein
MKYLGSFDDEAEAARKYDEHAGRIVRATNFPLPGAQEAADKIKDAVAPLKKPRNLVGVDSSLIAPSLSKNSDKSNLLLAQPPMILSGSSSSSMQPPPAVSTRAGKTSRFKGVSRCYGGQWIAQIKINNVRKNLGIFEDEEEAARKYDEHAARIGRATNSPLPGAQEAVNKTKNAAAPGKKPRTLVDMDPGLVVPRLSNKFEEDNMLLAPLPMALSSRGSSALSMQPRPAASTNAAQTSRFKGVTRLKGKWKAQIKISGDCKNLGHFGTEKVKEAAHKYYDHAARNGKATIFSLPGAQEAVHKTKNAGVLANKPRTSVDLDSSLVVLAALPKQITAEHPEARSDAYARMLQPRERSAFADADAAPPPSPPKQTKMRSSPPSKQPRSALSLPPLPPPQPSTCSDENTPLAALVKRKVHSESDAPDLWVQCDACDKWRRVSKNHDADEKWVCSMSTYHPLQRDCETPEESWETPATRGNLGASCLPLSSLIVLHSL